MADLSIVTQAANIIPPRKNNVIVIAVDSTSRSYDIRALQLLAGKNYSADQFSNRFFMTLQADGTDVYYKFQQSGTPDTIDQTATVTAGTALTSATTGSSMQGAASNGYCMKLVNNTKEPFCLIWGEDRYLIVKTASSTANLRIYLSSNLGQ